MITTLEYALMAGRAYQSTRADINKFPIPEGWIEPADRRKVDDGSGFEASVFGNGATLSTSTEIVISFAGTGGDGDWFHGNVPLALGMLPDQLRQAADYYLQVKASAPANATISFTGHSLGGGLAPLMAVMFGGSATTFDQAPFRNAAEYYTTLDNGNLVTHSVAQDLLAYLTGETANGQPLYTTEQLQSLASYVEATNAATGIVPNEANVTNINVQNEILSVPPVSMFDRIGTSQSDLEQQNSMPVITGNISLHSQALLTAMLQSGDTKDSTSTDHTLGQASIKLPDLLKMIFDENLFAHTTAATNTTDANFIERLVQHQATVINPATGATDAMVTRFTSDLWKLAQDGGLTTSDWAGQLTGSGVPNNVSRALIAFAMQMYYEDSTNATDATKQLFTDLSAANEGSNGIRFDITDTYSGTAATANTPAIPSLLQQLQTEGRMNLDAKDASGNYLLKGFEYFQTYLNQIAPDLGAGAVQFTASEKQLIFSILPYLRDWYVQAGAGGMSATDTQSHGAFMLGGNGADTLTGGTKADLLVGNAGDDVLNGGQGSDTLLGGIGVDTYVLNTGTGQGIDTVLDSDRRGYLRDDTASSIVLTGGTQYGDNKVFRGKDANGASHLYTFVTGDRANGGDLLVDGAMLIKGYRPAAGNGMGISLADATAYQAPQPIAQPQAPTPVMPVTARDISFSGSRADAQKMEFTNTLAAGTVIDPTWKWDILHVQENAHDENRTDAHGNPYTVRIVDSHTYTYNQRDDLDNWILDPGQPDLTRADTLNGSSGNDHIAGGGGGDSINATQGGDDFIEAGDGNNSVNAGSGNDSIIGGINNDTLNAGDGNNTIAAGNGYNTISAGTGDDIIEGGANNDIINAGAGNNTIIAADGNNSITAGDGNDTILTGKDVDTLNAGEGDNYLNAGDGINTLTTGDGNDTLLTGKDNDIIHAGSGDNYVDAGAGRDIVDASATGQTPGVDPTQTKSILIGGADADILTGGAGDDKLYADSAIDTALAISQGETQFGSTQQGDWLAGGAGDDILVGSAANDVLAGGGGTDLLIGGAGDDDIMGDSEQRWRIRAANDAKHAIQPEWRNAA